MCEYPEDSGVSCLQERWYYDEQLGDCISIPFKGKGGNGNKFFFWEDCVGYCAPPVVTLPEERACTQTCGGLLDMLCSWDSCNITCPDISSKCMGPSAWPVYGDGVYTDTSSVCRAAVHSGIIPATGGTFTVRYSDTEATIPNGSERNGIQSISYPNYNGDVCYFSQNKIK